jgi:hypothetical protein
MSDVENASGAQVPTQCDCSVLRAALRGLLECRCEANTGQCCEHVKAAEQALMNNKTGEPK